MRETLSLRRSLGRPLDASGGPWRPSGGPDATRSSQKTSILELCASPLGARWRGPRIRTGRPRVQSGPSGRAPRAPAPTWRPPAGAGGQPRARPIRAGAGPVQSQTSSVLKKYKHGVFLVIFDITGAFSGSKAIKNRAGMKNWPATSCWRDARKKSLPARSSR